MSEKCFWVKSKAVLLLVFGVLLLLPNIVMSEPIESMQNQDKVINNEGIAVDSNTTPKAGYAYLSSVIGSDSAGVKRVYFNSVVAAGNSGTIWFPVWGGPLGGCYGLRYNVTSQVTGTYYLNIPSEPALPWNPWFKTLAYNESYHYSIPAYTTTYFDGGVITPTYTSAPTTQMKLEVKEQTTLIDPVHQIIFYSLIVDNDLPTSSVSALATPRTDTVFTVSWSGSDPGTYASGVWKYDVQYRIDAGIWTDWKVGVTTTSSSFTARTGHTYYFQSRLHDNVGNIEVYPGGNGDTYTIIPALVAPTVTTTAASSIAQTTATSGGNVTSDGGTSVTARGVCWSTSSNPTTSNSHTSNGTGTGVFTSSLTGLTAGTTYHIRAYATNSVNTSYGSDLTFTTPAAVVAPTVTTTAASSIAQTTATSGGNVTADGGTSVTARGVCWSTSSNPTTSNSHTSNGTGTGVFTSSLTGLTAGTTYHIRAYATNSVNTSYGSDLTFTTLTAVVAPTVTTTAASSIAQTTATSGGNVTSDGGTSVTARGVCWSTSSNPTTSNSHTSNGTGTGVFTSSLTGLTAGTTYHIRAYATNSVNTSYGSDLTFTTPAAVVAPTVTTTAASSIAQTTATSGGNVTADGGTSVTARGVCWSTSSNPTTSNSHTSDGTGTGAFASSLTGLTAGTTYHIRAYATNSVNTSYGSDLTFTTTTTAPVAPTVTTTAASSITQTTATSGGNVTSDGGASVTARGVCWSTASNPTTSNNHTSDGTGPGVFTSYLTGLAAGTTYHIRAYATNSVNTSYGSDLTFTTATGGTTAPTVTTTAASSITQTTATSGGNVTSDGGASVTARGVCWSTSLNPTTASSHTSDGTGTGVFTSYLTGLAAGTTYHIRAYATNSVNTAYGSDLSFTTAITSTDPYEPNNVYTSAYHIYYGDSLTEGIIDPEDDYDWFYFDGAVGDTIQLTAYAYDLLAGSTLDSYLELYSSDGTTYLANSDDWASLSSRIDYVLGTSGRYYVKVRQFNYKGSKSTTMIDSKVMCSKNKEIIVSKAIDDYYHLQLKKVTSPIVIVNQESFEGTWPPTGWDTLCVSGTAGDVITFWNPLTDPAIAHSGNISAVFDWGYNLNGWLRWKVLDLMAYDTYQLSFWWCSSYYWHVSPYDNGDLFVKVSTNSGATWNTLWTFGDSTLVVSSGAPWPWTSWTWYQSTLDLSAYAHIPNVWIGFQVVANDNADICLDDVMLAGATGVESKPGELIKPITVSLFANHPNPVQNNTTISFNLPKVGPYTIKVYNITGKLVYCTSGQGKDGMNNVTWNASKVSAGVYFYNLNYGGQSVTNKMVIVK